MLPAQQLGGDLHFFGLIYTGRDEKPVANGKVSLFPQVGDIDLV
jgi:hypothetical protein